MLRYELSAMANLKGFGLLKSHGQGHCFMRIGLHVRRHFKVMSVLVFIDVLFIVNVNLLQRVHAYESCGAYVSLQ